MSTLNFPTNPSVGQLHTVGNKTYIWNGSAWIVSSVNTLSAGEVTITTSTNSVSSTTGALVVTGGVGIGGDLYVGGTINGTFAGQITGVATTATDVNTVQQNTSGTYYLTFVDSNNEIETGENLYTTSSFNINPATGDVYIGGRILTSVFPESDYLLIGRSDSQQPGAFGISLGYNIGTIGNYSVAIGFEASRYGSGSDNIVIGQFSGFGSNGNSSYGNSIILGNSAGYSLQDGSENVFIGASSGLLNTSSWYNTFVGIQSGQNVTGEGNSFFGYDSGNSVTTGNYNVILGKFSGNAGGLDIRTLNNNVVISDGSGNIKLSSNSSGDTKIWSSTDSTSTTTGALIVAGGVGINGNVWVEQRVNAESVRIADTVFDTTTISLSTNATTVIDTYSLLEYRSAKYFVQISEGTGSTAEFQAQEITVIASNTSTAFISEYGMVTTNGPAGLGTFDAIVEGDDVKLRFTPDFSTAKTVKVLRIAMEI